MSSENGDNTQKTPSTTRAAKTLLGEILVRRRKIKKYQLDFCLRLQTAYKRCDRHPPIGRLLLLHRAITPKALADALETQEKMPGESVTAVINNYEQTLSQIKRLLNGEPEPVKG